MIANFLNLKSENLKSETQNYKTLLKSHIQ